MTRAIGLATVYYETATGATLTTVDVDCVFVSTRSTADDLVEALEAIAQTKANKTTSKRERREPLPRPPRRITYEGAGAIGLVKSRRRTANHRGRD